MMPELPKLIIGCRILLADGLVHEKLEKVYCGDGVRIKALCPTCEHNLDAVKKNAAAHQQKYLEIIRLPEKYNKPTPDFYVANLNYEKGRLDAVLELAGLRIEDIEEK